MTKILQINITANWGSHGKIAEGIGKLVQQEGWESYIAYGRWKNSSTSQLYHIGCYFDEILHGVSSRLFDNHGLMSHYPTTALVRYIQTIKPDIIHLHNIHGYYINYPILFSYLKRSGIPVIWTLHDCWAFTGHCAHYMFANCEKWKSHCSRCPLKSNYPKTILKDNSYQNFENKARIFLSIENLTLVPVSNWLKDELGKSFFKNSDIKQIYNGIDTNTFAPIDNSKATKLRYGIPDSNKIILGVASNWYRKGLEDFIRLQKILSHEYSIVLVGLTKKTIKKLPQGIIGIQRTEDLNELISLYSAANVFFNPTWEDNFPTTNIEALSCGTPVITYKTGGSPESVDNETGFVIDKGDLEKAKEYIEKFCANGKGAYRDKCHLRAVNSFNIDERFKEYIALYKQILF